MRRNLYSAERRLNPTTTEKMPGGFRSGDTLPEPDPYEWDYECEGPRKGSVEEGVSMTEPMYADQRKVDRSKRK